MNYSPSDIELLKEKNIDPDQLSKQLHSLTKGNQKIDILAPATINNGISVINKQQIDHLLEFFNAHKDQYRLEKFVPASGAASRMFKDWVFFHENFEPGKDFYKRFVKKNDLSSMEHEAEDFIDEISGYAFYEDLMDVIKENEPGFFQLTEDQQVWKLIHYILSEDGLNYQKKPKMALKFHRYGRNNSLTPMEEQIIEAIDHTQNKQQKAKIHFSISPSYEKEFVHQKNIMEQKYPVEIDYSFQKSSTDTIMLNEEGKPVRDPNGNLVFRPGGHGSLLENLQDLKSDLVFIKNIDNVQKGEKKKDTLLYKKVLAGKLMELLQKRNFYLKKLENEKPIGEELQEIEDFARNDLNIRFIEGYDTLNNSGKRKYLFYKLNRPLRVAGMVKNTGEPGGGPFWAPDNNGIESLQIIEKSQIDLNDPKQRKIFESATHFNPVDLVIHFKDHKGNKYNLKEYVNENTAFISEKTFGDKKVKIYEHPGLWNGSMDGWNTVFIEVPLSTFTPVKTVKDLQKPAHF
jgi:hypothetical protein